MHLHARSKHNLYNRIRSFGWTTDPQQMGPISCSVALLFSRPGLLHVTDYGLEQRGWLYKKAIDWGNSLHRLLRWEHNWAVSQLLG